MGKLLLKILIVNSKKVTLLFLDKKKMKYYSN